MVVYLTSAGTIAGTIFVLLNVDDSDIEGLVAVELPFGFGMSGTTLVLASVAPLYATVNAKCSYVFEDLLLSSF